MIRIKELELKGGRYSVSISDGDKTLKEALVFTVGRDAAKAIYLLEALLKFYKADYRLEFGYGD